MASFVATPAAAAMQRSWAAVVAGHSDAPAALAAVPPIPSATSQSKPEESAQMAVPATLQRAVKPDSRGSRRCLCRGEVLVMLGYYGWIESLQDIDHPDVEKNGGRIYVHRRDAQETLLAGDIVTFFLYADGQGLGAEACHIERRAASGINADALESAPAVSMSAIRSIADSPTCMRADAKEFVPVPEWGSDPSENEAPRAASMATPMVWGSPWWKGVNALAAVAAALSDYSDCSSDSGDEASVSDFDGGEGCSIPETESDCDMNSNGVMDRSASLGVAVARAPSKASRRSGSSDSTSAGSPSDSEAPSSPGPTTPRSSRADAPKDFIRPPGLPSPMGSPAVGFGLLPPGMSPPPGLQLPPCAV